MVLVTGGTGLVGSYLLLELLRQGRKIRALYREGSDLERVRDLLVWYDPGIDKLWDRIGWFKADICDIPALETAFRDVSEVYHCAALISFDPADRNQLLKTNYEGTRNVVNVALGSEVAGFCYVSSIATIDGVAGPLSETDQWDPARTNVYATSKHLAEMEVWRAMQEGLPAVIVNPGVTLGAGFYQSGSGRFFSAVAGGLRYYPPGETGFVGVADVVRAMMELTAGRHFGERYLLVGDHCSYRDILTRIALLMGKDPPRKGLKNWQLEVLWRLDWLRARFSGKPRRLSRAVARSLQHPGRYTSAKILNALKGFRFTPIEDVLEQCVGHFTRKPGI